MVGGALGHLPNKLVCYSDRNMLYLDIEVQEDLKE